MPKKIKKRRGRPRKTKKISDQKDFLNKLEREKSALEEKNRHLLQIIEEISKSRPETEEGGEEEGEDKGNEKGKSKSLLDLKEFGERIKEKFEENKSKDDLKKDMNKIVKERIDSKFSELSGDFKKISNLEEKINKLAEKMSASAPVPASQLIPPESYEKGSPAGTISRGLASFGEEVDLETELMEIKRSMDGINKNLETLKKKTDYSITNIEDKIKVLERIPALEENFQAISEKLGPDNVQKLRKLIFSADELVDEVIPDLLGKKLRARLGPVVSEVKSLKHGISGVRTSLNQIKMEVLNLQKMKEELKALETEKDKLYKDVIGRDAKFHEGLNILKDNIKKRMETLSAELSERLNESQRTSYERIDKNMNKIFSDVIQGRLSEMENICTELGKRVSGLILSDEKLQKKLDELKAPEGVKKWVGTQLKSVQEQTIPEIKSVKGEISKTFQKHEGKIEKLIAEKEAISNTIVEMRSEIGTLGEKFLMEMERVSGLEGGLKETRTELGAGLDKQKESLADFRLELGKMIEASMKAMRSELEEGRARDMENQRKEMISELSSLKVLKKELDDYKKSQETRLEGLISEIRDTSPDIRIIKEKIGSLENLSKNLEKEKISESEFSSMVKMITSRIGEIEDHFEGLDEEIKRGRSNIEKTVSQLLSDDRIIKSSQESVGKALEGRLQDMNSSLSSELQSLSEGLKSNSETITSLNERVHTIDSSTKGIPKRIESHEAILNKMVDSKEFLVKRTEAMTAELKSLTSSLSSDAERIAVIEQELKNQSGGWESRIDELSGRLGSVEGMVPQVKTLGDSVKGLGTETRELEKRLSSFKPPESVRKWFNEKMQELDSRLSRNIDKLSKELEGNRELTMELRKKLPSLDSLISKSKEQDKDTSRLQDRIQMLDSLLKGVPKKLEAQEVILSRMIDSRESLAKRTEALTAELKSLAGSLSSNSDRLMSLEQRTGLEDKAKESRLDEMAKDLAKIEGRVSGIDAIKARVDQLESVGKSLGEKSVSESEFVSTVRSISKRIDDIEDLYKKLDKGFDVDKVKLQESLSKALSNERILKAAQESLGRWLEGELQNINKKISTDVGRLSRQLEEKSESLNRKLYSDVEKLSKQMAEQSGSLLGLKEKLSSLDAFAKQSGENEGAISGLKERIQSLGSLTRELPKKIDEQTKELNSLMGSSGFLTKRTESLESGIGALKEKMDSGGERLTGLEKEFRSHSKAEESRIDDIEKGLAGMQSRAQNSSTEIRVLKERLGDMEKRFEQSLRKSMEEKSILRGELKKQGDRVGRILKELRE